MPNTIVGSVLEIYGLMLAFEAIFYSILTASASRDIENLIKELKHNVSDKSENSFEKKVANKKSKALQNTDQESANLIAKFRRFTVWSIVIIGAIAYWLLVSEICHFDILKKYNEYLNKTTVLVFPFYILIKSLALKLMVDSKIKKIKKRCSEFLEDLKDINGDVQEITEEKPIKIN